MPLDSLTRKIDERIQKLVTLREMLSDPEMAQLAAEMLGPNSSNGHPSDQTEGITVAVQKVIATLPGKFTIRDVRKKLDGDGYKITAKNPSLAVGSVLKRLVGRHALRVVEDASGRSPKVYEVMKGYA